MNSEAPGHAQGFPRGGFATTHWTRVLAARGDSADAKEALSELCETYYAPVVTYLRCTGSDEDRARELAHDFFSRLLNRHGFDHVEPGRGRFRGYLLGALKHFLSEAGHRARRAKRGGSVEHVAFKEGTDTSPGLELPDSRALSPELQFDRQWAFTVLNRALGQLEGEFKDNGNHEEFTELRPWLTGDGMNVSQAQAAAKLGLNEGAVKVAIHRLRKRFRHLVKAEIGRTISDPEQMDDEFQSLIAALR